MEYILYHEIKPETPCPDGLAGAWVCSKFYPGAQILGAVYDYPPPVEPAAGDRVVIVDFSYPPAVIKNWADRGVLIELIDHHEGAWEDLHNLAAQLDPKRHSILFDMAECGASLAWKKLFPGKEPPAFMEFVRKRDLWLDCELFDDPLPPTLIVHEAMSQRRYELRKQGGMPAVFRMLDGLAGYDREALLNWAEAIALDNLTEKMMEKRETVKAIAGRHEWTVFKHPVINPTREIDKEMLEINTVPCVRLASDGSEDRFTSDVCAYLNKTLKPYFSYCITSDGSYSLRSDRNDPNAANVKAIAKALGGNGHPNSAGFRPKLSGNAG